MSVIDAQAGDYLSLCAGFRWQLPGAYNIARECCGRWAADRTRFALYYEEENGFAQAWTFWDLQREANRLSNALAALGTIRNDRVAIILPQRPETGISHLACYQMGAIALPLSPQAGPEALVHRLEDAGARIAIVDQDRLDYLRQVKDRLPHLKHVIGVGAGRGAAQDSFVHRWPRLLEYAASRYTPAATEADDPALIVYSGSGDSKGVLLAHRTLAGSLPGFVCAHDFYPQPGDLFWSPADWAESDGLLAALLPTWSLGQPILAYNGRFDPERAYRLMEKYGVRNVFLPPAGLALMRQAGAKPRSRYDLDLRSIASGGGAADAAVLHWAREEFGVSVNETFGRTEFNAVVGGCGAIFPPKPGAMGRPYPGHRVALLDAAGQAVAAGEVGEICVRRYCRGEADPVFMLAYWNNPEATRARYFGEGLEAWGRTGDLARQDDDGTLWHLGSTGAA